MVPVVGTHPALSHRLRSVIVAGFLALNLTLMTGAASTVTRVAAAPIGPGGGDATLMKECAELRIEAYRDAAEASHGTDPDLDNLLQLLQGIGQQWRDMGCQAAYGDIIGVTERLVIPPGLGVIPGTTQTTSR
jgi:hypothetical protein